MSNTDLAMQPVTPNTDPGPEYHSSTRLFQGIPGIERDPASGRLWATWYCNSREAEEGPDNYVVLVTSDDDGATWSDSPVLVVDPPGRVRAFDEVIWIDPLGRLWLFWAQSYDKFDGRVGVWCITTDEPGSSNPTWTAPRRIANGIMMNKPTVLSDGEWLLPTAVWVVKEPHRKDVAAERFSNVLVSTDQGETFSIRGGADVPNRGFDEHMVVERRDGSLWMLVRCKPGIGESVSTDGGRTWSPGKQTEMPGPDSRFFIRKLRSGNILLVSHDNYEKRNMLTAWLSDDDGMTWNGGLLLDERMAVSYPDGIEDESGLIRVVYDRERKGDREILYAQFREADVLAKDIVSDDAELRRLINRAG